MKKKFTVIAVKWFDRINGNTYHSVRCIRHKDNAVCVGSFRYGYDDHYRQTALQVMFDVGWLPEYLQPSVKHLSDLEKLTPKNLWRYERENDYPIIWTVSYGLKRECKANGKL